MVGIVQGIVKLLSANIKVTIMMHNALRMQRANLVDVVYQFISLCVQRGIDVNS